MKKLLFSCFVASLSLMATANVRINFRLVLEDDTEVYSTSKEWIANSVNFKFSSYLRNGGENDPTRKYVPLRWADDYEWQEDALRTFTEAQNGQTFTLVVDTRKITITLQNDGTMGTATLDHPDGKYAEMAREQKQFIIDSRPTDEERSTIGRIISAYFAALTDNNKEALSDITTSAVFSKSCDFIDGHTGNGVTSYTITSPVSIEKRPSDDGPTYSASCTVSRTATDSDGAPQSKTFSVRVSFNTQLQLSAMSMKGQDG